MSRLVLALRQGSPNMSKKCWSLMFKMTSPFPKTCILEAGFWTELQPLWPLFQFQKDFTVYGYKNYWYYSFQIQIKVKNFENERWNKSSLSIKFYSVCFLSMVNNNNSVCCKPPAHAFFFGVPWYSFLGRYYHHNIDILRISS